MRAEGLDGAKIYFMVCKIIKVYNQFLHKYKIKIKDNSFSAFKVVLKGFGVHVDRDAQIELVTAKDNLDELKLNFLKDIVRVLKSISESNKNIVTE